MKAYIVETDKLRHNLAILKEKAENTSIWGVVKGNGYGLGTVALARFLAAEGIDRFAVTDLREATELRQAGLKEQPVLMLRETSQEDELKSMVALNVICTLGSLEAAAALEQVAKDLGTRARAHVKIDTGMGRYGFLPCQWEQAAQVYEKYPHVEVTGIFTHFHSASREELTTPQYTAFQDVVKKIKDRGFDPGMVHCCNSLAFWNFPHMGLDGVRLGSALLGRVNYASKAGLKPVGWCEAEVEALKTVPKGHNVGYGAACQVKRDTTIAVVGVGYIHGFSVERGYDVFRVKDCLRSVGRYLKYLVKGKSLTVEINGKPCKVLGHVGMVNLIADVTDVPCRLHDKVKVNINPLDVKNMDVVFR